jgi:nuclear transport factor 2 (NTF2) superfamily protein
MSIWRERKELEKERSDMMKTLMAEWDINYYYPRLKQLRDRCEHNFKFSHIGPVGGLWYYCTQCGKGQFRDE